MKKTLLFVLCAMLLVSSCFFASCSKETEITGNGPFFEIFAGADEALKTAKSSGVVVFEDSSITSGKEIWNEFYKNTQSGSSAMVTCAYYYTLDKEHMSEELYEQEKDNYPVLYFSLVEYDGEKYTVKYRDSDKHTLDSQGTFKYLKHFKEQMFDTASYETHDCYYLVDDNTVTYQQIRTSLFSSDSREIIKCDLVYSDYIGGE